MWSVTQNILILIEKFLHIINDTYSEVLIAKYGGSRMNNACTVCLADFAGLPAKVIWLTTYFLKKKLQFLYGFCVSHQLANLGVSTWVVFNITACLD